MPGGGEVDPYASCKIQIEGLELLHFVFSLPTQSAAA
jgi:hypothetical protein